MFNPKDGSLKMNSQVFWDQRKQTEANRTLRKGLLRLEPLSLKSLFGLDFTRQHSNAFWLKGKF